MELHNLPAGPPIKHGVIIGQVLSVDGHPRFSSDGRDNAPNSLDVRVAFLRHVLGLG